MKLLFIKYLIHLEDQLRVYFLIQLMQSIKILEIYNHLHLEDLLQMVLMEQMLQVELMLHGVGKQEEQQSQIMMELSHQQFL